VKRIVAIVAPLLILAGALYVYFQVSPVTDNQAAPPPPSPQALAQARTLYEASLAGAPEFQLFFDHLKTAYPSDFDRFQHVELTALADRLPQNISADAILLDSVDLLRKSRGLQATKASDKSLDHIFEVQARVLDALASQDARLCDHFLFGGDAPAFADFSSKNRPLIAEMAQSGLDAITDGEAKNTQREAPGDEDFALLEKSLTAAGLNPQEISALLDGQMPETPFDKARTCAIGKSYYGAMATLTPDTKYRIYALALESMAQ